MDSNIITLPDQIVCHDWVNLTEKIITNDLSLDPSYVYFVQRNQDKFFACCYLWTHFSKDMWKDPTKISIVHETEQYLLFTGPCANMLAIRQADLAYFVKKYQKCVYYVAPCFCFETQLPLKRQFELYCSRFSSYMNWSRTEAYVVYILPTNYLIKPWEKIVLDTNYWSMECILYTLMITPSTDALSEEDIDEHADSLVANEAPLEEKFFMISPNLEVLLTPIFAEDDDFDRHQTVVEIGLSISSNYKIPHFYALFSPLSDNEPSFKNLTTQKECYDLKNIFWINRYRYRDVLYLFSQWPTKMNNDYQHAMLSILWYPVFAHKKFWSSEPKSPYWERDWKNVVKRYPLIETLNTGKYNLDTPNFLTNLFARLKNHEPRDVDALTIKYRLPIECTVTCVAWNKSQWVGLPRLCSWYELAMLAWIWMYG